MAQNLDLYYKIKQTRHTVVAPVDLYGCGSVKETSQDLRKAEIMLLLLLSSQTKDPVTHNAVSNLKKKYALVWDNLVKTEISEINECINKVGYHNKKSRFIKEITSLCRNGMPNTLEEVVKLPGVGYKMGILYMYYANGEIVGISVDTHVFRIANRLGLVCTKSVEDTRKQLEGIFDVGEWPFINYVLVGFGQTICTPLGPKCNLCCVNKECPSSKYDF